MSEQYGRTMRIVLGAPGEPSRDLRSVAEDGDRGLHLAARVRRTQGGGEDVALVIAHNLAPASLALLQADGATCEVWAGYGAIGGARPGQGSPALLLSGRVLDGSIRGPTLDGADRVTEWMVSDGGLDLRTTPISESWGGEVSASEILDRLIVASGLARGSVEWGEDVRWPRYVAWGALGSVLSDVAEATDSRAVIVDGAIHVWPVGGTRRRVGYVLEIGSGLLAQPERRDPRTWTVPCILIPGLHPGDRVTVRSRSLDGPAVIAEIEHDVDSVAGPYRSTLVVEGAT